MDRRREGEIKGIHSLTLSQSMSTGRRDRFELQLGRAHGGVSRLVGLGQLYVNRSMTKIVPPPFLAANRFRQFHARGVQHYRCIIAASMRSLLCHNLYVRPLLHVVHSQVVQLVYQCSAECTRAFDVRAGRGDLRSDVHNQDAGCQRPSARRREKWSCARA